MVAPCGCCGRQMRSPVRVKRVPAAVPRNGFTLVELLVVMFIISVLIALLLPALAAAHRLALATDCASNERQIYMSYAEYASDNLEFCPVSYLPWEGTAKDGSPLQPFGNVYPWEWNYGNIPYLTNRPWGPNVSYSSPDCTVNLPAVYICPVAAALDPGDMNLTYPGGGGFVIPSYAADSDYYIDQNNNGKWYDPKLDAPRLVYSPILSYPVPNPTVNSADAGLLYELNTPAMINTYGGGWPYAWWKTGGPSQWWNFGDGSPLGTVGTIWAPWLFGFFHGGSASQIAGAGGPVDMSAYDEVGDEQNVTFFDGHVALQTWSQIWGAGGSMSP
ncbi:MAG: prepilin-type N-terminal cleavage/methylation domain-containing protein [Phycisphaerae bacterium]|nr:prepilin-type N-terminal cleavage/methylation domain-containing protein [Phycisphaerae bacterium]